MAGNEFWLFLAGGLAGWCVGEAVAECKRWREAAELLERAKLLTEPPAPTEFFRGES